MTDVTATAPKLLHTAWCQAMVSGDLTLRSWFEPRGDGWVITRTVASTW
ncbi:hypothetical protein AB4Y67_00405 [Arthrobacter sp. YAF17]